MYKLALGFQAKNMWIVDNQVSWCHLLFYQPSFIFLLSTAIKKVIHQGNLWLISLYSGGNYEYIFSDQILNNIWNGIMFQYKRIFQLKMLLINNLNLKNISYKTITFYFKQIKFHQNKCTFFLQFQYIQQHHSNQSHKKY